MSTPTSRPQAAALLFLLLSAGPALAQREADAPPQQPDTKAALGLFAGPDGTLAADGHAYHARFDGRGATLQVADPAAAQAPLVALTLRLEDWGRDGAPTARRAGVATPIQAGHDRVHFAHAGLTERYRVTSAGFEQSFVLHERPAGGGDLVLGISATSTQLTSPERPAQHQTIEFGHHGAAAIAYGEAFAFCRADGNREDTRIRLQSRYDGNGRIELVVPAAFLDRASFPVVVDPAVGPVQSPGGSGFADKNCDVGFDPQEDVFVCVWERRFSTNDRRIRAQRYGRNGVPLGGLIQVTSSGFHQTPTVAYLRGGSMGFRGFYVVWSSSNGLQGRRIDSTTGSLVGGVHQLTSVPSGTRDLRPTLSMRSTTALLAWDRTPAGTANPTEIRMRRVQIPEPPSNAVTLGNEFVIDSTTTGFVRRVRMPRTHVVTSGAQVRLVWERWFANPAPGDYDVRTAYVAISNLSIGFIESATGVPDASAIGVNERRPDIAQTDNFSNNAFALVVWEDTADVRGLHYNSFGPNGSAFDIRATSARETAPAVGAGSTEFSVGYLSAPSSNPIAQDVYASRVEIGGGVLSGHNLVNALGGPLQVGLRASSVAGGAGPSEPNGVLFGWELESAPAGLVEDIRVRQFDPVAATVQPFGTPCPGPMGTAPAIATTNTPYPGNFEFEVALSNAPPASIALLLVGDQFNTIAIPGAPGCELYMDLPVLVAVPTLTNGAGDAWRPLPIPVTAPPGAQLALQWAVFTPGHNALGWITSDDIDLFWQH